MSYFERKGRAEEDGAALLIYDPGKGDNADIDLCSAEMRNGVTRSGQCLDHTSCFGLDVA